MSFACQICHNLAVHKKKIIDNYTFEFNSHGILEPLIIYKIFNICDSDLCLKIYKLMKENDQKLLLNAYKGI